MVNLSLTVVSCTVLALTPFACTVFLSGDPPLGDSKTLHREHVYALVSTTAHSADFPLPDFRTFGYQKSEKASDENNALV